MSKLLERSLYNTFAGTKGCRPFMEPNPGTRASLNYGYPLHCFSLILSGFPFIHLGPGFGACNLSGQQAQGELRNISQDSREGQGLVIERGCKGLLKSISQILFVLLKIANSSCVGLYLIHAPLKAFQRPRRDVGWKQGMSSRGLDSGVD